MRLNDQWTLISSAVLADAGEEISLPDYTPSKSWMPAVVPGTILSAYVKAGGDGHVGGKPEKAKQPRNRMDFQNKGGWGFLSIA